MKEIVTEISISASPEKVWKNFTDFARYPRWNPFINSLQGNVEEGNRIRIRLTPPDARPISLRLKEECEKPTE